MPWSSRRSQAAVDFNGKLWVLGGAGNQYYNDVWSSPDGINWSLDVANAPWQRRSHHSVTVFGGRMWLMGGQSGQGISYYFQNDVWSSADGVNWTLELPAAPWAHRAGHTTVAFNNRLWLCGGAALGNMVNEVWSSADGVNWTLETASAAWGGRSMHCSVVYVGRLWVIGGAGVMERVWNAPRLNDVWSSVNGTDWVCEVQSAPWTPRHAHACVVFNERLFLLGGNAVDANMNDVWSYGLHMRPKVLPDGKVHLPYEAALQAK